MAKFKLELEDLNNQINTAFGLLSQSSALKLCYRLNEELHDPAFQRLNEDLYSDFKDSRFLFRTWGYYDSLREFEVKLIENRSYESQGPASNAGQLFEDELEREKNWLTTKDGFNFFLWFEGNIENVSFTLSWAEKLSACSSILNVKALSKKDLERLNKSIKYYDGL